MLVLDGKLTGHKPWGVNRWYDVRRNELHGVVIEHVEGEMTILSQWPLWIK